MSCQISPTKACPPPLRKHVWFTGFMATGKSRIGALVAERLGVPFEDIDHWIEARHRKSVSEIFAEQGEAAFREIEIEALRHLSAEPPRVIALGEEAFSIRTHCLWYAPLEPWWDYGPNRRPFPIAWARKKPARCWPAWTPTRAWKKSAP
ncbi:MAG: hypothetical protein IPK50_20530 [Fibrobacterota bacterium]|nr:MAG: hypothetical protein IPK50_20530 [Fibrobacterota bacterium]